LLGVAIAWDILPIKIFNGLMAENYKNELHVSQKYDEAKILSQRVGWFVERERILDLLEQEAIDGNLEAKATLSYYLVDGRYGRYDVDGGMKALYSLATRHDVPVADFYIGTLLAEGKLNSSKNIRLAMYHLKRAASNGDANALGALSLTYWKDTDVEIDKELAFEYLFKAAKKGHSAGKLFVGLAYMRRSGVEKNEI